MKDKILKTIKIIYLTALPLLTIYLFLQKTIIIADKGVSKFLITLVSASLVSSIVGALVGGLIAIFIAKMNNKEQKEHSEKLLDRQIELSERHFKNQQLLEFKKLEINFYLDNLDTLEKFINELDDLINNKITPLTKDMAIPQEVLKENKGEEWFDKSFKTTLAGIQISYKSFYNYMGQLHSIINHLETLSFIFDNKFSYKLQALLEQHPTFEISGLIRFEGYLNDIWEPVVKQYFEKEYYELEFYEVNYDIVVSKLMEHILTLKQKSIPLERKNKVIELKNLIQNNE